MMIRNLSSQKGISLLMGMLAFGIVGISITTLVSYMKAVGHAEQHSLLRIAQKPMLHQKVLNVMEKMVTGSNLLADASSCPSGQPYCEHEHSTHGICRHILPLRMDFGGLEEMRVTLSKGAFDVLEKYWNNRWNAFFSSPDLFVVEDSKCSFFRAKRNQAVKPQPLVSGPTAKCIRSESQSEGMISVDFVWAEFYPTPYPVRKTGLVRNWTHKSYQGAYASEMAIVLRTVVANAIDTDSKEDSDIVISYFKNIVKITDIEECHVERVTPDNKQYKPPRYLSVRFNSGIAGSDFGFGVLNASLTDSQISCDGVHIGDLRDQPVNSGDHNTVLINKKNIARAELTVDAKSMCERNIFRCPQDNVNNMITTDTDRLSIVNKNNLLYSMKREVDAKGNISYIEKLKWPSGDKWRDSRKLVISSKQKQAEITEYNPAKTNTVKNTNTYTLSAPEVLDFQSQYSRGLIYNDNFMINFDLENNSGKVLSFKKMDLYLKSGVQIYDKHKASYYAQGRSLSSEDKECKNWELKYDEHGGFHVPAKCLKDFLFPLEPGGHSFQGVIHDQDGDLCHDICSFYDPAKPGSYTYPVVELTPSRPPAQSACFKRDYGAEYSGKTHIAKNVNNRVRCTACHSKMCHWSLGVFGNLRPDQYTLSFRTSGAKSNTSGGQQSTGNARAVRQRLSQGVPVTLYGVPDEPLDAQIPECSIKGDNYKKRRGVPTGLADLTGKINVKSKVVPDELSKCIAMQVKDVASFQTFSTNKFAFVDCSQKLPVLCFFNGNYVPAVELSAPVAGSRSSALSLVTVSFDKAEEACFKMGKEYLNKESLVNLLLQDQENLAYVETASKVPDRVAIKKNKKNIRAFVEGAVKRMPGGSSKTGMIRFVNNATRGTFMAPSHNIARLPRAAKERIKKLMPSGGNIWVALEWDAGGTIVATPPWALVDQSQAERFSLTFATGDTFPKGKQAYQPLLIVDQSGVKIPAPPPTAPPPPPNTCTEISRCARESTKFCGSVWHYTCGQHFGGCKKGRKGSGSGHCGSDKQYWSFPACLGFSGEPSCKPCADCVKAIPYGGNHGRICGPSYMDRLKACDSVCNNVWSGIFTSKITSKHKDGTCG